jgi:hypothetical protein
MAETMEELKTKLQRYEEDGVAKLYYALNRKAWEMADLLNDTGLKTIKLDDPKDKTFDRLKIIWQDAASIATAVKALGESAGVTGNEKKDVERKPFIEEVAETRK